MFCRQRKNSAERQLQQVWQVHAGLFRLAMDDRRLYSSGLLAGAVADNVSGTRGEELPCILSFSRGCEGKVIFISSLNALALFSHCIYLFLGAKEINKSAQIRYL